MGKKITACLLVATLSIFVASMLLPLTISVHAQEPDEEEPSLVLSPVGSLDLSLAYLGYPTQAIPEEEGRWHTFYLPSNLELRPVGNYLELVFSHQPPIPNKPSVIHVVLNGATVGMIPLTEENADVTNVRLDLADVPLKSGRNSLLVSLLTSATCEERGAIVEATLYEDSTFHLEYGSVEYPADLSLYPVPFYEFSFLRDHPVYFVLPERLTSVDLSAAATIAAGLGKLSGGKVLVSAVSDTELTPAIREHHHLIVIGRAGANRLLTDLDLPLPITEDNLTTGQGVIEELVSPWSWYQMIMVISSLSDEGLIKASQALNREAHFLGMKGPVSIVDEVKPPPVEESGPGSADLTLASLGYEDEVIYGAQAQTVNYYFGMPLSWRMAEEPAFVLSFSHSNIIDPNNSALDVYLNDIPVGSTLLDNSNAQEGLLSVDLPAWLIKPGGNKLQVAVEMNFIEGHKCIDLADERAWTVLRSDSFVHLPFMVQDTRPELRLFPYPFTRDPDLRDVVLVVPDNLPSIDRDGMLRLAVTLGAGAMGNHLALQVVKASEVDEALRQERHLIVLGRPTVNALLAELNPNLPQPFVEGTDLLAPAIDSVVFAPDPTRDAGLLEELASPWGSEQTALVVTGTTDPGLALAYTALLERSGDLRGNLAVIEGIDEIKSIYATETRSLVETVLAMQKVEEANAARLIRLAERWW